MTERAKIVDKAFWMAQTNAPDIYTKGRVRFAAALRKVVEELKYIGITEKNILELADEVEAL